MNTQNIKSLLLGTLVGATIMFAVGADHPERWEYKVADASGNTRDALEPFLNNMAKDGWILVQRDSSGWFYFRRVR
jgi:hypothetical protein